MRQPSVHCARKRSALTVFDPLQVFNDNCLDLREVNLFDLSRQFFLDLLARVFFSFAKALNLGVKFLSDLLAIREDQPVAVVGIHPYHPAFCFRLRTLLLEDQFDPQSAAPHAQPDSLGELPAVGEESVDRRCGAKGGGQAWRARADKDGGKVDLFTVFLVRFMLFPVGLCAIL